MMYETGKEKAITMVALIVTVIVLLILAGVTINLVLGQNGILNSAQISSNTYANSTKEEREMFNEIEETIIAATPDERTLVGLYKNGAIKLGDYINYEIPESGEFVSTAYGDGTSNGFTKQSYNVENNGNAISWRVLGLGDDNGKLTLDENIANHLLLISAYPVQKTIVTESENEYEKDPYLYMGKAESYTNGEKVLNEISKIYINNKYADRARSINAEDINTLVGMIVDNDEVYEKDDEKKENRDVLRLMGSSYNYIEGEYSAESYLNNRTALENGESYALGTGYSYSISNYKTKLIGNTTLGELLFNETSYESKNSKAYWLATKGIEISRKVGFGLGEVCYDSVNTGSGKFYSNGKWVVQGLGVYPIISLKSNVTKEDLQLITSTEQSWNYTMKQSYSGTLSNYKTEGQMNKFFY